MKYDIVILPLLECLQTQLQLHHLFFVNIAMLNVNPLPQAQTLTIRNQEYLKSCKGCITCLSLFYDEASNAGGNAVQWVVEKPVIALAEETGNGKGLTICAGCEDPLDHENHNTTTLGEYTFSFKF